MFIRLTRPTHGDDLLVCLKNVRYIHPYDVPAYPSAKSLVVFDQETGQGAHVEAVAETLDEIIRKIDEVFAQEPKDLAERSARYRSAMAVRKLRRALEYRAKAN